jgi:DNA (cytosine-5)-methyltransferase 1
LLDLFCGAGGASKGYELAGFTDIVGVDNTPMPHYPNKYSFILSDALEFLWEEDLGSYDLIHASPPCQSYSRVNSLVEKDKYARLIEPVREILIDKYCNYVIENVEGAPLINPIILEGNMFGLLTHRRRYFEVNWPCDQPKKIKKVKKQFVSVCGHGGRGMSFSLNSWSLAMGIWWMDLKELTQAVPPAYTKYIGIQFINQ